MRPFVLNGDVWRPVPVDHGDLRLVDRTGTSRPATTGPSTMCAYISNRLRGIDLEVVSTHEVGHCAMHGYGPLDSPHALIPEDTWVDVEVVRIPHGCRRRADARAHGGHRPAHGGGRSHVPIRIRRHRRQSQKPARGDIITTCQTVSITCHTAKRASVTGICISTSYFASPVKLSNNKGPLYRYFLSIYLIDL